MNMMNLVNVNKRFGGLVAVDDIDLCVEEGEVRGLIGPNGSGKTTLLNLISGFLMPTKGRIAWLGHDITRAPVGERVKKGIVRTFQLTTLFEEKTALQNVVAGLYLRHAWNALAEIFGIWSARRNSDMLEQKATDILGNLGMAHMQGQIAGALPHGYQRSLGIAVALASQPKLILLDEPLAGMNPIEKRELMEMISTFPDKGITVLLVEHDIKTIMRYCHKITVLNFGKKIAEGSPNEVRANQDVIKAYLGDEVSYA